ncbi:MAG: NUDIX hydrolase [Oryzihumus sp.]
MRRDFPLGSAPALVERAQDWLGRDAAAHDPVAPRSAATVMLVRDGQHGVEVSMLRRVATMEFAPRMMVFPGGGVDPRDADPALPWAGPSAQEWGRVLGADETTARELVAAAVREVFEECGVLLAGPDADSVVGDVSGPDWQADRAALLSREVALSELLVRRGLVLRSDLLRARAHWITPEFESRRYDTRFFAAELPEGQVPDDATSEADHAAWVDPAELLRDYHRGEALMLPPTVVNVEEVAAARSADEFLREELPIEPVMPVLTPTEEGVMLRCELPV